MRVINKIAKAAADALVRRIAMALPAWTCSVIQREFPARAPYQPLPPVNSGLFSVEAMQRFHESVRFRAHRIYQLRNVHVTWNGAVFHNLRLFVPSIVQRRFVGYFQDTLLLRQWIGEKVEADAPCIAVCHDQWSVENYYHWLIDTLPRLLLLRQTHPDIVLALPQPLPPKVLPEYISSSAAVLGFSKYLLLNAKQVLHSGCIILPELTAPSLTQNPELVRQVRAELVKSLTPGPVQATRRVFIARARGGVRSLVNEQAVDALLKEFGFEKIYGETLSFLEQVRLMRETAVLIGVHGAGMTNMLFLQEGMKVVEFLNDEHGDLCYFRLASCLGLPYFLVPCKGSNAALANQSDMLVDTAVLRQVMSSM